MAAEKREVESWEAGRLQLGRLDCACRADEEQDESIVFSSQRYFLQKSNNKQKNSKNNLDYE